MTFRQEDAFILIRVFCKRKELKSKAADVEKFTCRKMGGSVELKRKIYFLNSNYTLHYSLSGLYPDGTTHSSPFKTKGAGHTQSGYSPWKLAVQYNSRQSGHMPGLSSGHIGVYLQFGWKSPVHPFPVGHGIGRQNGSLSGRPIWYAGHGS